MVNRISCSGRITASPPASTLRSPWHRHGRYRPAPGSVYRSPQVYEKLKVEMNEDNFSADAICNGVAVAGYLNATLLIPNFHFHNIGRDPSKFEDIYDEDYLINALKNNDMVAFSCCVFDGGEQEKEDMENARERGWKGKFTKPGRVIRPGAIRINGNCPLTPLVVGLMLRGMGFEMFPNLQTKEMLASEEELAPYKNFSSRMAAIDYTICLHSEVFVTTQGGNFPNFLVGHRRYLFGEHSKTIRPDKRKLALLFDNPNIGYAFIFFPSKLGPIN
ncbi:Phytanoyl-CoA dioxygenase (PhyH) family protein isoform 1 [Hibiscus syriacus]|uniref:O-fucosyltransferase family protein n=1 Tax=Hibiscus syriacus TaxID=106335 RepID=A0A6A3ATS4_HIBSY|nr:Phytanoyl-CoA dioxygenase (PhyH) family protein isoform 1 [Hibiscus syriacus]